jgi:RNA polymerase sigma-70 factor, ECF subfamily
MGEIDKKETAEVESLVQMFQNGSVLGLERLYLKFKDDVFRFLVFLTRDEHQASELFQQVWHTVLRKSQSLKNPTKFKAWILRIAHRQFLMSHRKREEFEVLDEETADESFPENLIIQDELKALTLDVLNQLPEDRRALVWLVVVEDYSHAEVGKILNIPEGTARSRLHYSLKFLRKKIEERNDYAKNP